MNRVAFSTWLGVASMCVYEVFAMLSRVCFPAPMTYPTLSVGIVRSSVICSPDSTELFYCGVEVDAMLADVVWRSICCICPTLASACRRSRMFLMQILAPCVCVRPCTITTEFSSLLLMITLILLSDSILVICCPFWPLMYIVPTFPLYCPYFIPILVTFIPIYH